MATPYEDPIAKLILSAISTDTLLSTTDKERLAKLILLVVADEFALSAALNCDIQKLQAMKLFKEILESLPPQASQPSIADAKPLE